MKNYAGIKVVSVISAVYLIRMNTMSEKSAAAKDSSVWLYPRWLMNTTTLASQPVLLLSAAVVGLLGGLGATAFKELSTFLQSIFIGNLPSVLDAALQLPWYMRLLVPTAGGALAGMFLYL